MHSLGTNNITIYTSPCDTCPNITLVFLPGVNHLTSCVCVCVCVCVCENFMILAAILMSLVVCRWCLSQLISTALKVITPVQYILTCSAQMCTHLSFLSLP